MFELIDAQNDIRSLIKYVFFSLGYPFPFDLRDDYITRAKLYGKIISLHIYYWLLIVVFMYINYYNGRPNFIEK